MTEYRMEHDGIWNFLQYKTIETNFWGIKKEKWNYVPDARFSSINNLQDYFDFDRIVCSYHHDLKRWVERYPNVEDWFIEREKLIQKNREKRIARDNEIENKKGKITYL